MPCRFVSHFDSSCGGDLRIIVRAQQDDATFTPEGLHVPLLVVDNEDAESGQLLDKPSGEREYEEMRESTLRPQSAP